MRVTLNAKRLVALFLIFCLMPAFVPAATAAETNETDAASLMEELRLPYAGGWAAADAATTTITVAASDSSAAAKSQANYVCSGSNDHVEIQTALDALPAEGGIVLLTEGTFNCAGNIQPGANKVLKGQGDDKTVLSFPGDGGLRVRSQYVTFADFKVTGKADMIIETSHARIQNVTMTVDNSRIGAFYVWAANKVVEDVEFIGSNAIDCGRYGFLNSGEGDTRLIKNIRYFDCEAINCGKDSHVRTGPWVTGFDIVEKNDVDGAWIVGCYAEGNQESGFHLEGFSYLNIKNVNFIDCVSINNAAKGKDACMFGAGFTVPKGTTLENCTSANNKHGFLVSGGSVSQCSNVHFVGCTDEGSNYGFVIRHGYDCTFTDCESKDAVRQGLVLSKAWNIDVKNFSMKNAGGYRASSGSSDITAAKFAGTKSSDDQFAYNMWDGPLTNSRIDIHAEGCDSNTVLYFGNAKDVTVTGTIVTESENPVRVSGGSNVNTSGLVITDSASVPAEPESTLEPAPDTVKPVQTPWPV